MIQVRVDIEDGINPALLRLIGATGGAEREALNQVGGRAASEAAKDYHQDFNQAGGWKGKNYMDAPQRDSGAFGQNVSLGWHFETSSPTGATISNSADFYAFKVRGGTIRPKRVSKLTIPMVPEAVSRRAADYVSFTGNKLFRIKGKNALFETMDEGGIRAVYALVDEVTQAPWPEALPDKKLLSERFKKSYLGALADLIEATS